MLKQSMPERPQNSKRKPRGQKYSVKELDRMTETLKERGWPESKWITFCRLCLDKGYEIYVHRSKSSKSKYIYVVNAEKKVCKVRFSDHQSALEHTDDCDFYVGKNKNFMIRGETVFKRLPAFFGEDNI